ncbi:aminotransferase class I/II-fold pyridoxal phosphate-dependent enzyme [Corynebacterium caspium]|uniref:aminotransferase class I/II-fold pyridoxal phosphate-dependent enzyme n=1 Tax=Corynebacterium caspium TaxID=234828 RepID=UPI0003778271|nr:aminotransferase class I/II-fold pyridoxal phosphate-dependent enzyme [Corynebacterium caspium]WKD58535.1 Putative aminotransferase [Corynebacterium caspium DSM 44850]
MSLLELSSEERAEITTAVRQAYEDLKAKNLALDLTRGKPSAEQLDISEELLSLPGAGNHTTPSGEDVRNYGNLTGIKEIRSLWAQLINTPMENVIAADSSSLNIMFDLVSWATTFGTVDSPRPWGQEEVVKWLCPVPGYDRHFAITEHFGFQMIPVPMTPDGPCLETVAELLKDPQVKGMWTVPMFSNPSGVTFTEEVARALASMEAAAPDFRIIWDNAYALHTLTAEVPEVLPILDYAAQAGNPNRFWVMSSTSKITQAGAGVAFFASSTANLEWYGKHASVRGIGPNKVNQWAHVEFFKDPAGVRAVMDKHAKSLAPKFAAVLEILEERLGKYEIAQWTKPTGGYFISLDVMDGTATRVVELAKAAGIALTSAGSSFPLGHDPLDRNIRLAPSLPPLSEVRECMDGVATCVLLAALEKIQA